MKKNDVIKLAFSSLIFCILFFSRCSSPKGSVTLSFKTVSYGGVYAPRNSGAIWVEDGKGNFIKTLKVWAPAKKHHLAAWNKISLGNEVDAVTSASLNDHENHQVTWDCTDHTGRVIPDEFYKIHIEFTEGNISEEVQGKHFVVAFNKSRTSHTVTPEDQDFFQKIELKYIPQ